VHKHRGRLGKLFELLGEGWPNRTKLRLSISMTDYPAKFGSSTTNDMSVHISKNTHKAANHLLVHR